MDADRQIEVISTMPGICGHIACEVYDCQYKKQPLLAVQAALCIMSILKGQIRIGPTNLACNIYTVGTAGPGKGKDAGIEYAAKLFDKLDLTQIYNAGVGSSVGFIEGLKSGLCANLLLWDEMGKDFSHILDEKGNHPYLKAIAHELMKLYSRSRGVYSPQVVSTASGRGNFSFYRPIVTILGATVPEPLFNSIKELHIMDGLLPRFIYFKGLDSPEKCRNPLRYGPSSNIIEHLKYYKEGTLLNRSVSGQANFIVDAGDVTHIGEDREPVKVSFSTKSNKDYKWIADSIDEMSDALGGFTSHLLGRAVENILKVAVIVNDSKELEERSLEWAHWLIRDCLVDFIGDIDSNAANNYFEVKINKAKKLLKSKSEMSEAVFLSKMKIRDSELKELISYLKKTNSIEVLYKNKILTYKWKES